jgi:hypothetical protein
LDQSLYFDMFLELLLLPLVVGFDVCVVFLKDTGMVVAISVLRRELPGYLGFEAEDVSVHWWSLYYHFGECPQISQDLTSMLRELHRQCISGPMLPHLETIMDHWPPTADEVLAPEFVEKPAHQRVANYTTAHVEGLVKKCNVSMVGLNLSQISVNYRSDIDSDHVDYV